MRYVNDSREALTERQITLLKRDAASCGANAIAILPSGRVNYITFHKGGETATLVTVGQLPEVLADVEEWSRIIGE